MPRLIVFNSITLDGYFAGENVKCPRGSGEKRTRGYEVSTFIHGGLASGLIWANLLKPGRMGLSLAIGGLTCSMPRSRIAPDSK